MPPLPDALPELSAEDNLDPAPENPAGQGTAVAPTEGDGEQTREPGEGEPEELEAAPEDGEEEADLDGDEPTLETADVEIDGVMVTVPKVVEDHILRHNDYSKKTLEVSEAKEAVEKQFAQVNAVRAEMYEDIQEVAQLHNIDSQLAEYEKVDWNALNAEDPEEFNLHHKLLTDLRETRRQVAAALTDKGQKRASAAAADAAKRSEITRAALARDVPNWGPGKERDLVTLATNHGIPDADIKWAMDNNAGMIKILDLAHRYSQLVNKQKAASKASANPAAKPAVKVSGRRAGQKAAAPSDTDSTDEWMKKRERQMARKAAS